MKKLKNLHWEGDIQKKELKEVSRAEIFGKSDPGRGESKYTGPEAAACLPSRRNIQEASVPSTQESGLEWGTRVPVLVLQASEGWVRLWSSWRMRGGPWSRLGRGAMRFDLFLKGIPLWLLIRE